MQELPGFLTAIWEAFITASPQRKGVAVLLLVVPLAALIVAYLWFNPTPYRVLYSQLSDRAGGEVIAALERMAIPYRLSEADGSIEVPANQLHAARFRLAAQGLPKSGDRALEAADDGPRIGLSSSQEQQRYQRMLESELARSIQGLAGVELARVHLALPRTSPFLREAPPATAAVLLRVAEGQRLSGEQVTAIRSMIAASVPRLRPGDVRVVDQSGTLLGAYAGEDLEEPRVALERDLARRVLDVLGPWLGAERVNVQVTAVLEEGETRQTVERYRDRLVAGEARPLEKSVQTTRLPEGRIRRLNATVILGFDATTEQLAQAEALARQALALDRRRGDSLSVFALPLAVNSAPAAEAVPTPSIPAVPSLVAAPTSAASGLPLAQLGLGILAVALLLVGAVSLAMRRRRPAAAGGPEPAETFDSLLEAARRRTLDDPRVTADVIRLWMRA